MSVGDWASNVWTAVKARDAGEGVEYEPVASDPESVAPHGVASDANSRPVCQRCAQHSLVVETDQWVCPACGVSLPRTEE